MSNPWALLGFAVFIPIALFEFLSARNRLIKKSLPANLRRRLSASRAFFALFLACLVIAFAGPRWGTEHPAAEYRRAVDAVIAIDVSRSMEVPDGLGSGGAADAAGITRLERGLEIVREAVEALPGMRFAAAVSRNRGIVAVPLTWGNGTALSFLESLDSTSLTGRGTNLESLIDAAAGAFQSFHPSSRVILLVSDGEELSGSLKDAIERCGRDGIAVAAIAVGSDEGGPVPGSEETISRRDSGAMRIAAAQTGGIYIDGNREDASDALAAHMRMMAPELKAPGETAGQRPRWHLFVMLAIIAFGISKFCLLKTGRKGLGTRD